MNEILSKLGSEEILAVCGMLVGVVAILGGITVAITKVVSSNNRRKQLDEMETTLKLTMIERGMSADEIQQILEARLGANKRMSLSDLLHSHMPNCEHAFGKRPEKV